MKSWTKQRAGRLKYLVILSIFRIFGYRLTKAVVFFISMYYVLIAKDARDSLRCFYLRLGVKPSLAIYGRHFYSFALHIFERILYNNDLCEIKFSEKGNTDKFYAYAGESAVLLCSAHFGNWQQAAVYLSTKGFMVNTVGVEQDQHTSGIINGKKQNGFFRIEVKQDFLSSVTEIARAVKRKDLIAAMPDRFIDKKYAKAAKFIGDEAFFNTSQFVIAAKMNLPVVFAFVTRKEEFVYDLNIYVYPPIKEEEETEEYADRLLQEYVRHLNMFVQKHPDHWFNFYNFWS